MGTVPFRDDREDVWLPLFFSFKFWDDDLHLVGRAQTCQRCTEAPIHLKMYKPIVKFKNQAKGELLGVVSCDHACGFLLKDLQQLLDYNFKQAKKKRD